MIKANEILERLLSRWFVPRRDYAATLGALKDVNKALDAMTLKAEQLKRDKKCLDLMFQGAVKASGSLKEEIFEEKEERRFWQLRCEGYEDCLADIGLEFRKKGNNSWQLAKREPPQVQSCAIANKSESAAGAAADYRYSLNSPPDYSKAYNVIPKQED